jgi:hypothetical protein
MFVGYKKLLMCTMFLCSTCIAMENNKNNNSNMTTLEELLHETNLENTNKELQISEKKQLSTEFERDTLRDALYLLAVICVVGMCRGWFEYGLEIAGSCVNKTITCLRGAITKTSRIVAGGLKKNNYRTIILTYRIPR